MSETIAGDVERELGDALQHRGATGAIHERMVAILFELPSIGKDAYNPQQKFHYRAHDDVLNALNPLLAKHGVYVTPNVLERIASVRTTAGGKAMYEVSLHVEFTFHASDGSSVVASTWGEGTDLGDKATNKAMTAAFKYALFQTFAISTAEASDSDGETREETVIEKRVENAPPALGSWTAIRAMLSQYGPGMNDDFNIFGGQALERLYPGVLGSELNQEQKDQIWRASSRAATFIRDNYSPQEFPPPARAELQKAWSYALDSDDLLPGPAWRMSPSEAETHPLKDESLDEPKEES